MSNIARGNVEILVHTTAPSLGVDDTRYRTLAQAYLDFEPRKRRKLDSPMRRDSNDINIRGRNQVHEDIHQYTREERQSEASWRPDEEEGPESASQPRQVDELDLLDIAEILDSPDLSFMSVLDNRTSPTFRGQITCRQSSSQKSATDSWQAPGSEVPDSQPDIHPVIAAFCSPTRILEVFLQNRDGTQSTSLSERTPERIQASSGHVPSVRESPLSPLPRRINRSGDVNSLEVLVSSDGNTSSSQNLPPVRNNQGPSPELGGTSERSSIPSQTDRLLRYRRRKDGVEVEGSSEAREQSSQSLPRNKNRQPGSLEVGVSSEESAVSLSSPRNILRPDKGSLEVEIASERPSLGPQTAPSKQNTGGSSLGINVSTKAPSISSLEVAGTNLPRPTAKDSTKQLGVLRHKSPNTPLDLNIQSKKRKLLGSIPETQVPSSSPPALALDELPNIPQPAKKQRLEPVGSPIQSAVGRPPTSSSSIPPSTRPKTTAWTDRLEIHPPPPQTSTGILKPEMLIVPKLHDTASRMPLHKYFLPREQSRDLKLMERGYWLVNCSSWSEEVRTGCWNFLGELIGKGLAGWGVWCVRDAKFESFRVYCWGIVVGHIYLVLKAASLNRISKSGACWIDGGGKSIIHIL